MNHKKIIFMGSSSISEKYLKSLLENNFKVIAVYTQPPRKKGRGMTITNSSIHNFAIKNKIPVLNPINFKSKESIREFKELDPDISIVMGYGLLLPKAIINIPRFGCINIHVSLLPRWRGASPIEHAIIFGDTKTGVSIFRIEEKLDSGPIIASSDINIKENISKEKLTTELYEIGNNLLIKSLPKIFNKEISFKKQDNSKATYAKKITSEFRKINFNNNVINVYNFIRAFSPNPAAWFTYNSERFKIIECSMEKCESIESAIINEKFHIGCINGKIIPKLIQREGKKVMKIEEFIKGFKFQINQKVNA
tara:strand:- start:846 stop:1772 length:927 start_codon:yes stop_codon:yes gene_type:complete